MVTGPCLHTVGTRVGGGRAVNGADVICYPRHVSHLGARGAVARGPHPPDPYGEAHIAPSYEHSGERPHRLRA